MTVAEDLRALIKSPVRVNESMARHTSWQVGGPADYFVCPESVDEVTALVHYCETRGLPLCLVGNGSNLLVLDGGIRGLVLKIGDPFNYIRADGSSLTAGAGVPMTALAKKTSKFGLTGLEFAVGIPGLLGGALVMNTGAFGGQVGELVGSVTVVTPGGETLRLHRDSLQFGYRTSNLVGKGVIVEACLELRLGQSLEIEKKIAYFLEERFRRHPGQPSAGSVFRNFADQSAGKIIEEAGGKGMRVGGAEVSRKHANFIVNRDRASASDILTLIDRVRLLVKARHGLELEPEIRIIGEES